MEGAVKMVDKSSMGTVGKRKEKRGVCGRTMKE